MDLEFTGSAITHQTLIDTPAERYYQYKKAAEKYRIIQVGLVLWHKKDNNSYIARPYNFYVFPYEEYNNNRFDMEVGAIIFNREHGIDFNKWINQGVSYVNNEQLKRLSEHLLNDNINKYVPKTGGMYKQITLYKKTDKDKYSIFVSKFKEFMDDPDQKEFYWTKMQKHLMLYFLNSLPESRRNSIYISNEKKNEIKIRKVTKDEKMLLLTNENNQAIQTIIKAKGFKNIYDKIIEKKKTVVGHNCLIDLLYCTTHFMDELPYEYETFKKKLCNDYGAIYDTKYLYFYTDETKVPSSSDTKLHLEDIYKFLRSKYQDKVQISIPNDDNESFVNYLGNNNNLSEKFHQADFDAFVTGCTFLYLREEYGSEKIEKNVFHFNLIASIYKGMNMLDEDKLKYENVRLLTFYNLIIDNSIYYKI